MPKIQCFHSPGEYKQNRNIQQWLLSVFLTIFFGKVQFFCNFLPNIQFHLLVFVILQRHVIKHSIHSVRIYQCLFMFKISGQWLSDFTCPPAAISHPSKIEQPGVTPFIIHAYPLAIIPVNQNFREVGGHIFVILQSKNKKWFQDRCELMTF